MRNMFRDLKIKRDLKKFQEFKKNFVFEYKELDERTDGSIYYEGVCLREGKDGDWLGETETFVNVGYKIHGAMPKVLSNLFPYNFYFHYHSEVPHPHHIFPHNCITFISNLFSAT